ncbi:unnamed protein product [Polarella glacialis]|uniref:Uncharacterized protein n=1 Tax=Polarella glacialis TaxID=89957 RepID=A0A813JEK6_POLGL|nr:unnamed protein product [Polarella glacialis]
MVALLLKWSLSGRAASARQDFLEEDEDVIRKELYIASLLNLREPETCSFFERVGDARSLALPTSFSVDASDIPKVVGLDFWRFVEEVWSPGQPSPEYLFADAERYGLKCSLLVLCYERISQWHDIMRRVAFPALPPPPPRSSPPSWLHTFGGISASDKWYGEKYKHFMAGLEYSPEEVEAICTADTMRLPFYAGACRDCDPNGRCHTLTEPDYNWNSTPRI